MFKKSYTQADLDRILQKKCSTIAATIVLTRECVGGQPATDKGVAAFIKCHLGIDPEKSKAEFDEAFARIKKEEIGDRSVEDMETAIKADGEIKEEKVYAINVVRRSEHGAYLMEHMVKACLKNAATRTDYFMKNRGAKGDLAEMGLVKASGSSLLDPARPWEIYAYDQDGKPVATVWRVFRGSVQTPTGRKSIVTHCECLPEGSLLSFTFNWVPLKMKPAHLPELFAAATRIGLGSTKSFGCGRFTVVSLEVEEPDTGKE